MSERAVLRLAEADNVATALRDLTAGEVVEVDGLSVELREAVPLCHKLALREIPAGTAVLKYGLPIGTTKAAIPVGAHVHVHNMRSNRAQREGGG